MRSAVCHGTSDAEGSDELGALARELAEAAEAGNRLGDFRAKRSNYEIAVPGTVSPANVDNACPARVLGPLLAQL